MVPCVRFAPSGFDLFPDLLGLGLMKLFTNILDEIAPTKHVQINNRTEPWMSGDILEQISKTDKALKIANKIN